MQLAHSDVPKCELQCMGRMVMFPWYLPMLLCSHWTQKFCAAHFTWWSRQCFKSIKSGSAWSFTHLNHPNKSLLQTSPPRVGAHFSVSISHLLGPCWATASGPATLSQLLRLWLQTVSAFPWTSVWSWGFWSSACLCSAHSAWPRAPGSYPVALITSCLHYYSTWTAAQWLFSSFLTFDD